MIKFVTTINTQPTLEEKINTLTKMNIAVKENQHPYTAWISTVANQDDEWITIDVEMEEGTIQIEITEKVFKIMQKNKTLERFVKYLLYE